MVLQTPLRHTQSPLRQTPLQAIELAPMVPASPLQFQALKPRAPFSRNLVPPERLIQRLAACVRLHELQLHELLELRLLASHAMCKRLGVLRSRSLNLALSQLEALSQALIESQSPQCDVLRSLAASAEALHNLSQILPSLGLSFDNVSARVEDLAARHGAATEPADETGAQPAHIFPPRNAAPKIGASCSLVSRRAVEQAAADLSIAASRLPSLVASASHPSLSWERSDALQHRPLMTPSRAYGIVRSSTAQGTGQRGPQTPGEGGPFAKSPAHRIPSGVGSAPVIRVKVTSSTPEAPTNESLHQQLESSHQQRQRLLGDLSRNSRTKEERLAAAARGHTRRVAGAANSSGSGEDLGGSRAVTPSRRSHDSSRLGTPSQTGRDRGGVPTGFLTRAMELLAGVQSTRELGDAIRLGCAPLLFETIPEELRPGATLEVHPIPSDIFYLFYLILSYPDLLHL